MREFRISSFWKVENFIMKFHHFIISSFCFSERYKISSFHHFIILKGSKFHHSIISSFWKVFISSKGEELYYVKNVSSPNVAGLVKAQLKSVPARSKLVDRLIPSAKPSRERDFHKFGRRFEPPTYYCWLGFGRFGTHKWQSALPGTEILSSLCSLTLSRVFSWMFLSVYAFLREWS